MNDRNQISVFCSGRDVDTRYVHAARAFALLMIRNKYDLVWGGSDTGLMHVVASTVKAGGGRLIGVTIKRFLLIVRKDADEMIVAPSLGERKRLMIERGCAIVVLPGGIGTADELMEVLERKKQGEHHKPVVVLNTSNFYRGIHLQLDKMSREGFIPMPLEQLVYFAETPTQAIQYMLKSTA